MADTVSLLFSPRIRTKELAQLCRRLATSLAAGIDLRAVWKREAAGAGRGCLLHRFQVIRRAVADGQSTADGIDACGDFFPELFRQLARVGDQTGSSAEVFAQLADHYNAQLKRRRLFLAAIVWPIFELTIALLVVALLIWIAPFLKADILGFGLTGSRGLGVYVAILSGVGIMLLVLARAFQRGLLRIRRVEYTILKIPVLGPPLKTLALSRLAWVMHLTMSTGMDVRQAMRLTLSSTNCAPYLDQIPKIDHWIVQGGSIYEAFSQAGGYPPEFLDTLHVGEESGRLVEAMGHLSEQYQDRARVALIALMTLAGFAVLILIGVLIIMLIFRIFLGFILPSYTV